METIIYTLSDGENIRYIGKTTDLNRRYKQHLYDSKNNKTYKERWIHKILLSGGKIVIETLDVCDIKDANFFEKYWIQQFKIWGFSLVNLTDGGNDILYLTKINKGRKKSEETKNKISNACKGKTLTEEHKSKISEKLKLVKRGSQTEEHKFNISISKRGKPSLNKGKTFSHETRLKQSIAKKGKKRSDSFKEKISNTHKKHWIIMSPEEILFEFDGLKKFSEYIENNKIKISLSSFRCYGKSNGWILITKN